MQHHKVTIDFIGPRGNLIGYWSDYVPIDSDADGLIDYLYEKQLVRVNWDRVRCIARKANKRDRLGWHRNYNSYTLPVQLVLGLVWLLVCNHYVDVVEWGYSGLMLAILFGWLHIYAGGKGGL